MNEDTIAGKFDKAVGKVKQSFGEAVGDQSTANSGAADQVKGSAKETWGNVKDATSGSTDRTTSTTSERAAEDAHDTRNSITSAAERVKDKISNAFDSSKH